jgi:hypothetical protein
MSIIFDSMKKPLKIMAPYFWQSGSAVENKKFLIFYGI